MHTAFSRGGSAWRMAAICAGLAFLGQTQAAETSRSPFADKPADSYSNVTGPDGKPAPLIWGQAPFTDFGSRPVTCDQTGVRQIPQAPPAGVHPRICFGPEQIPDVRRRLKETRCGQEAWKNLLCWTEMMKGVYDDTQDYAKPDRWKGSFGGLHGRVPLFRMNIPRENKIAYNRHPKAAAIYRSLIDGTATEAPEYLWNVFALEAFRCLIDDDAAAAQDLGKATCTMLKLGQAKRIADQATAKKKKTTPNEQPIGGFQLAFTYDYIWNWLTPEQRQTLHAELADSTWSHDNYGTFNTAESSRSNWATFSYWLYQVLAIEGEPGFNDLKVRGMYRGWRNLLTYGWFQSGATFEGEAKNQLGMDGILLFASRMQAYGFENLAGHPYLRAYATRFMPHSINPMLEGFHKYDLLGGSRSGSGGYSPCDLLGLKYMFPEDKTIDWVYRKAMGDDYAKVPERPDGYFNALLFYCIYATDFDPANNDPTALNLGNTFFCGERSLLMTRSGWDTGAMMLNLHTRAANGGHPFADRNAVMVAGAGRIWSPNGYASFTTAENSVVGIDGRNQDLNVPGRMVDYQDAPNATFAIGDAKYAWSWNWKRLDAKNGFYTRADVQANKVEIPAGWTPVTQTVNDFAFTKLPFTYLDRPHFEYPHWIKPNGALSPYVRQANFPVQRAFRTAGLVRGVAPYGLVIDDIQKDAEAHRYDWTLALEDDVQIASLTRTDGAGIDIVLTGDDPNQTQPRAAEPLPAHRNPEHPVPAGQPLLLVRILDLEPAAGSPAVEPTIVEPPNATNPKKYQPVRRLVIPVTAIAPRFKVLLFPYTQGDPLPTTTWDAARKTVTVSIGNQVDQLTFTPGAHGKTDLRIERAGTSLISLTKPVSILE